ncbi:MAG: type VI secretion protein IcmF/TssM N-terminal domain-containing protein [Desulfosalsimonas sp.]|uniref:type VI secretion protein IcmF/TssM N-terminal domain-containing protein n=1 Tax=Desulfosalsimonas sp. TaxID=3073848 RepID=UPI0039707DD2
MIRKILKFFLYAFLLLALAAGIAFLVIAKQWPWWVGAAMAAGVLGLVLGFLFLKRYLLQRRERKFVKQIIAQDDQAIGQAPKHDRRQLQELQEKWKKSLDLLRQSNLKKAGNPLYVLPWYMVMGESGTGKTTAIKNAKANSPVAEVNTEIGGTRNFDWWFFDEAIVLDTAGRYAIPIDQDPDREEWERFLGLLAKYRKKEPLNGLILTVGADQLLTQDSDTLRENGLNLRKRIDQLMRVCGAKFPVYLMVTKTDRVHGFNPFSRLLPEDRLNQAMGYSSPESGRYWEDFLDSAHRRVCNRLKDLRLLIIQHNSRPDPGVLMFPDEFEKLHAGLKSFAEGTFQENPYQETPMLMGVYYSSGTQTGAPCSEFVQQFSITCPEPVQGRNGIFLRDFFKRILPADRHLFRPILEYLKWRRLTRRFGLTAWALLCLCLLGMISLSYIQNTQAVKEIARHAQAPPDFTGEAATDVLMLDAYGRQLGEIREFNRDWRIPRFGLTQSLEVENRFVDRYVQSFRDYFLKPMDDQLEKNINQFDTSTRDSVVADYAAHMVGRIRVLQDYLKGRRPDSESALTAVSSEIWLVMDETVLNDIALEFGRNYYKYLELADDRQAMARKVKTLQGLLSDLLKTRATGQSGGEGDLNWLTAKKMPHVAPVSLNHYWGELTGSPENHSRDAIAAFVPAAYTRQGKERIHEFIGQIKQVLEPDNGFETAEKAFWRRYENDYLQAWANFGLSFSGGPDFPVSGMQRRKLARSMSTPDNAYFQLLSEMAQQLEVIDNPPAWAAAVLEIEKVRNTRIESRQEQASLVDRIRDKGSAAAGKTLSVTSPEAARKREKQLAAAEQWHNYLKALEKLQPAANRRQTAFEMAGDFFSPGNGATGQKSEFHAAQDEFSALLSRLAEGKDPSVAGVLLEGPLAYMADFAIRQAQGVVQKKWESMVLSNTRGMDPGRVPYSIFKRPDGAVWKFLDGPAKPFVDRGKDGFYAASALNRSMGFKNDFFLFLDQGADGTVEVAPEYNVEISTLPVQVNEGAKKSPYAVMLNLSCADGQTQLKNFNFRETRPFKWQMNQCGGVELTILMPDTKLKYRYPGEMGFARFLRDFRDGVKNFTPEDFPEQSRLLKNWGISSIRVAYQIQGAGPVIRLLTDVPSNVPETIIAER